MLNSKYLAEAIATFFLVFIGAGTVIASNNVLAVAIATGLTLMVMVYATAHVSGAHINPAVTLAMWSTNRIKSRDAFIYIISQLIGAVVAGIFLLYIYPAQPANLGATVLGAGVSLGAGTLVELLLTFMLVFVIFAVTVDNRAPRSVYGAAIGLTLTAAILMGGPLTGAALNPARAFGPAVAAWYWEAHVIYWIGPIVGAIAAALVYTRFFLRKPKVKKKKFLSVRKGNE